MDGKTGARRPFFLAVPSQAGCDHAGAQLRRSHAHSREHYPNYNGGGYAAPATLYKLAWQLDAKAAACALTLHYAPLTVSTRQDLRIDGRRYPLDLTAIRGRVQVRCDRATHPCAMQVELTVAAPFGQGTALPLSMLSLGLSPWR